MKKIILILILSIATTAAYPFGFKFNIFSPMVDATGGSITYTDSNGLNPRTSIPYTNGYTVHTYLSSGTFRIGTKNILLDYLVVGGGGGNVGGAGGMLTGSGLSITTDTTHTISVGVGGAALPFSSGNGQNSSLGTYRIAIGGGGGAGGSYPGTGGTGGSGGGGYYIAGAGSGTPGQGNAGGAGVAGAGGGGGGAGQAGGSTSGGYAGKGGDGLTSSISGINKYYAGGASGYGSVNPPNIDGGLGGGGRSATYYTSAGPTPGVDGLGGGGGLSQVGGSGIVIIRHKTFR